MRKTQRGIETRKNCFTFQIWEAELEGQAEEATFEKDGRRQAQENRGGEEDQ